MSRFSFSCPALEMRVEDHTGTLVDVPARGVDLSAGGLAGESPAFMYPGRRCLLRLDTRSRERVSVSGEIAWCEFIEGHGHRFGIRFGTKIDPRRFVSQATINEVLSSAGLGERCLGRAIVIASEGAARERAISAVVLAGLEASTFATPEEALTYYEKQLIDLVVAIEPDPMEIFENAMRAMRSRGFEGPLLVALSGEAAADAPELAGLRPSAVLESPINADALLLAVSLCAEQIEIPSVDAEVRSVLQRVLGISEPIEAFIEMAKPRLAEAGEAFERGEIELAAAMASELVDDAQMFGFPTLARALEIARDRLASPNDARLAEDALRRAAEIAARLTADAA
ncbi:MAG: PilZ domain-containing protein [Planctomycetota bacterium]